MCNLCASLEVQDGALKTLMEDQKQKKNNIDAIKVRQYHHNQPAPSLCGSCEVLSPVFLNDDIFNVPRVRTTPIALHLTRHTLFTPTGC